MDKNRQTRTGAAVLQPGGYRAFLPARLPFAPWIKLDDSLLAALDRAALALGRLDGVARMVPNPDLFVFMYVRQEAVLSSRIEGTQASLMDVLKYEAAVREDGDAREVVNYVAAMNLGLQQLRKLPLSVRLIRNIHARLMRGVRGGEAAPGELRRLQNWIGPAGSSLETATFVPPPPQRVPDALANLEIFLHGSQAGSEILRAGIAHAQFETIHPFLDGNGRVGRLLVTFVLCAQGVLSRPLLYLSAYFMRHRAEYYRRLNSFRDGDVEGWLQFFAAGAAEMGEHAAGKAHEILRFRDRYQKRLAELTTVRQALPLLDAMLRRPVLRVPNLAKALGLSVPRAYAIAQQLERGGVLTETTGRRRDRVFAFQAYLDLFSAP